MRSLDVVSFFIQLSMSFSKCTWLSAESKIIIKEREFNEETIVSHYEYTCENKSAEIFLELV